LWTWMDQSAANNPFTASFLYNPDDQSQAPDALPTYSMRSPLTVVAGKNSANIIDLASPTGITRGSTYNWFFSQDMPTEYVWDWNVTFEKEVMNNTMVRLGYVGNHAGNQMQAYSFNDAMPSFIWYYTTHTPTPTGTYAATALRYYDQTTYGTLDKYIQSAYSNFQGVQFVWERRYSKGFSYELTYVMGNAMRVGAGDYNGGYANAVSSPNQYLPGVLPTDYYARDYMMNYRRDTTSPKHRIRWNWMLDMPFGKGKPIAKNAHGVLNQFIGGWQLAGMGALGRTYASLNSSYYVPTGEGIHQYGYNYPIMNCTTGTCYPGYLWYNGYISPSQRDSYNAAGQPNGYMGLPKDYQPYSAPFIKWNDTTFSGYTGSVPAGTNIATYYDTNNIWILLNTGQVQRSTYSSGFAPWRSQYIPGPWQWSQDVSMYKRFRVAEGKEIRFNFDAFNVFNHPNNGSTDGGAGSSGTGLISTRTQPNAARQLQLAIRFTW